MQYNHITKEERVKIEVLTQQGYSNGDIATTLGRSVSAIGKELTRNGGASGYRASAAEKRRRRVRRDANVSFRKLVPGSVLTEHVTVCLKKYWSPEQVAGRLRHERSKQGTVCHQTIYTFIRREAPELKIFLRCRKGKYRRRYGTKLREKRREQAKKRRIDTRPACVEKRTRVGDWEGDTIVGAEKTCHIVTHVDRKSGMLLADKVTNATARQVCAVTVSRFSRLPKKKRHTVTYDNGTLFAEYERTERMIGATIYFARPYRSTDRATNENTNGLLRQFFPKKTLFEPITKRRLDRAVTLINERPRKRLNYRTPLEMF